MTRNRKDFLTEHLWLIKVAMNYKALGVPQGRYLLAMLADGKGARPHVLSAALVYLLIPHVVAKGLRRVYRRLSGLPDSELRIDRSRL